MNAFGPLLIKELMEIRRTWRIWVLPGIMLFVGLTSAPLARLTPRLLKSIAADQPGTIIQIPTPTALDAYSQFVKSLDQIVLLALVITAAGLVAGERRAGTAILVLTKPVARAAFLLAKFAGELILLAAATLAATLACWLMTLAIFGEAPVEVLLESVGLWFVFATMFLALTLLCSTLLDAQAGAAGLGLGIFLIISILATWGPARDYSPAGLPSAASDILTGSPAALVPLLTTLLVTSISLAITIYLFNRQELTPKN